MTSSNTTTTAAKTLQELNAKLEAALANPDMDVDRHQLRRELDMIAIAEGGEVGRLVERYHQVVESQIAALNASAPRRREEAKVVWEGEFDGFKFVMDADGNLAYGDLNDDGPIVELDRRQAVAMMKFWGDIFCDGRTGRTGRARGKEERRHTTGAGTARRQPHDRRSDLRAATRRSIGSEQHAAGPGTDGSARSLRPGHVSALAGGCGTPGGTERGPADRE